MAAFRARFGYGHVIVYRDDASVHSIQQAPTDPPTIRIQEMPWGHARARARSQSFGLPVPLPACVTVLVTPSRTLVLATQRGPPSAQLPPDSGFRHTSEY
jgi:hypothetical protein